MWTRYERWKQQLLHRWELSRLDRPRFRRYLDLGSGLGDDDGTSAVLASFADQAFACDLSDRLPTGIDLAYLGPGLVRLRDAEVQDVLYRLRQSTVTRALVIVRDLFAFNLGRHASERRPRHLVELAESVGLECLEVRSSPMMFADMTSNAVTFAPMTLLWRLATIHWRRALHTFVFHT